MVMLPRHFKPCARHYGHRLGILSGGAYIAVHAYFLTSVEALLDEVVAYGVGGRKVVDIVYFNEPLRC